MHAKLGPGASAALAPVLYAYLLLSCTAYLMIAADCLCPLLTSAAGPDAWWAGRQAVVAAVGLGMALPLSLPRTLGAVAGEGWVRIVLGASAVVWLVCSPGTARANLACRRRGCIRGCVAAAHLAHCAAFPHPAACATFLPAGVSTFKVYAIAFVVGAVLWRAVGAVGEPDYSWAAVHASTLDLSSPDCWQGLAVALPILAFGLQVGKLG